MHSQHSSQRNTLETLSHLNKGTAPQAHTSETHARQNPKKLSEDGYFPEARASLFAEFGYLRGMRVDHRKACIRIILLHHAVRR
jgi:hypothetical protein